MNKEDINELLEYNNEYMEAQISEELFGGDYSSAVELHALEKAYKRQQQELERYKNIIDELEQWLKDKSKGRLEYTNYDDVLNKLKELKGTDD